MAVKRKCFVWFSVQCVSWNRNFSRVAFWLRRGSSSNLSAVYLQRAISRQASKTNSATSEQFHSLLEHFNIWPWASRRLWLPLPNTVSRLLLPSHHVHAGRPPDRRIVLGCAPGLQRRRWQSPRNHTGAAVDDDCCTVRRSRSPQGAFDWNYTRSDRDR